MVDQRTLVLCGKLFIFRNQKFEWEEKLPKYFPFCGLVCEVFLYSEMPCLLLNMRQDAVEFKKKKLWGWLENRYVTSGKLTCLQSQIYGMYWHFLYLLPLCQSSLFYFFFGTLGLYCSSADLFSSLTWVLFIRGITYSPVTPMGGYNISILLFPVLVNHFRRRWLQAWVCCPVVPLLLGGPFLHLPGC